MIEKKIQRSYRFSLETLDKLERISDFYSKNSDDMFARKVPVTTILETLIEKEYQLLKEKGYSL